MQINEDFLAWSPRFENIVLGQVSSEFLEASLAQHFFTKDDFLYFSDFDFGTVLKNHILRLFGTSWNCNPWIPDPYFSFELLFIILDQVIETWIAIFAHLQIGRYFNNKSLHFFSLKIADHRPDMLVECPDNFHFCVMLGNFFSIFNYLFKLIMPTFVTLEIMWEKCLEFIRKVILIMG